jgi:NTP pyrophosphatase (non-canonical NTP hydrolase)
MPKLTLDQLQIEVHEWAIENFGDVTSDNSFFGMVEELGELSRAILKQRQGIKGTYEEHEADKRDAIGDILIFMADFCTRQNISIQECLEEAWSKVKLRDWKNDPKKGKGESEGKGEAKAKVEGKGSKLIEPEKVTFTLEDPPFVPIPPPDELPRTVDAYGVVYDERGEAIGKIESSIVPLEWNTDGVDYTPDEDDLEAERLANEQNSH